MYKNLFNVLEANKVADPLKIILGIYPKNNEKIIRFILHILKTKQPFCIYNIKKLGYDIYNEEKNGIVGEDTLHKTLDNYLWSVLSGILYLDDFFCKEMYTRIFVSVILRILIDYTVYNKINHSYNEIENIYNAVAMIEIERNLR